MLKILDPADRRSGEMTRIAQGCTGRWTQKEATRAGDFGRIQEMVSALTSTEVKVRMPAAFSVDIQDTIPAKAKPI